MLTDVKEDRDVVVSDVVGVYLLDEMKYHVIVKLTGKAVEVLCTTNKNTMVL